MDDSSHDPVQRAARRFLEMRRSGVRVSLAEVAADAGQQLAGTEAITAILRSAAEQSHTPAEQTPASRSDPMPDIPGYLVVDFLGRGGMGAVYEGYQLSTGRRVAIKLLTESKDGAAADALRRRFEREVDLASRLQHPNIVAVLDSGAQIGRYYYVMEYVDGHPLDVALIPGECSLCDAARVTIAICAGVDYAHQRGVLHRDLKPSNILLDALGMPRILDFGLAKSIDPQTGRQLDLTLSEPGQMLGTLGYMSPEQARGDFASVSVRSDVYGLGAILYWLIAGRMANPTDLPLHQFLNQLQHHDPPPLSLYRNEVPRDLDALVLRCLRRETESRYGTAAELADDLKRFLEDRPVRARPVGIAGRAARWIRRNRAVATVTAGAALVLATGGIGSTIRIVSEGRRAQRNEQLAREKLRFALEELEHAVFDTNRTLENVLGTEKVRSELIAKAVNFYERLPRDAALLGLEKIAGPQYGKLGDALLRRGMTDQAGAFFALCLASARAEMLRSPGSPEALVSLAAALQGSARTMRDQKIALENYREAVELTKALPQSFPAKQTLLADALTWVAEQSWAMQQPQQAEQMALDVFEIGDKLLQQSNADASVCIKVLRLYQRLVQTAHFRNAAQPFVRFRGQAAETAKRSAERWTEALDLQYESLFTINLCAEHSVTRGHLEIAEELLQSARLRIDALLETHPREFKLRLAAAATYSGLAGVARARGENGPALGMLNEASAVVRPALELQPNEISYRRAYSAALSQIADVYMNQDSAEEAAKCYREYLSVSEPLFDEDVGYGYIRAYAWFTLSSAVERREPQRAMEFRNRAATDLRRVANKRPLNAPERELLSRLGAVDAR